MFYQDGKLTHPDSHAFVSTRREPKPDHGQHPTGDLVPQGKVSLNQNLSSPPGDEPAPAPGALAAFAQTEKPEVEPVA